MLNPSTTDCEIRIKQVLMRQKGIFTKRQLLTAHPALNRNTLDRIIKQMVADGTLIRYGTGRSTCYAIR